MRVPRWDQLSRWAVLQSFEGGLPARLGGGRLWEEGARRSSGWGLGRSSLAPSGSQDVRGDGDGSPAGGGVGGGGRASRGGPWLRIF